MDIDLDAEKDRRFNLIYAVASSVIFALISCGISISALRFEAVWAHGLFVLSMIGLYILLLATNPAGNIEGAVVMVVVLILIAMLGPPIFSKLDANTESNPASDSRANQ